MEHLRLLIDLGRLDVPLVDAAQIASWCHSGHCADTSAALPSLIAERRREIAQRLAGLQALDSHLARLQQHLTRASRTLSVLEAGGPCCDAADAVIGTETGGCDCCALVRG